jgi:GTPase SAR1 family protein
MNRFAHVVCAKVVVLGDAGSGKTSFCSSLQQAWPFEELKDVATGTTANFCEEYYYAHIVDPDRYREDEFEDGDSVAAVTVQLMDQSGTDRESLQPIIFRKAAGIFLVLDAPHFFAEFMKDLEGQDSQSSGAGSRQRVSSPFFRNGHQSQQQLTRDVTPSSGTLPPYTWQEYAQDNAMHWSQACYRESTFVQENEGLQLPLIVVVARCDLLPPDGAAFFTNFVAELRMCLKSGPVAADDVVFVSSTTLPRSARLRFPEGELCSPKKIGLKISRLLRERMLPLMLSRGMTDSVFLHTTPLIRKTKKEKCEC